MGTEVRNSGDACGSELTIHITSITVYRYNWFTVLLVTVVEVVCVIY